VTGWLFALPVLLYFVVWVFAPILAALGLTFLDWNGMAPLTEAKFVGFDNVEQLLGDSAFLQSFQNTFTYTVIVVASGTVAGMVLALALNEVNRFSGTLRAIYFAPVMLPGTAMAVLWTLLYQPAYGLFNQILQSLGLPTSHWLLGTESALLSICLLVIWKSLGWYMLIFLAGLKSIPDVFYEAAKIDGAGGWMRFWKVTFPLMKPTTLFVLAVSCIDGLQVFSPVYVMTQGGPANSTDTVVYHMYMTAFNSIEFSYATTMAIFLFAVILVVTLAQIRLFRDGGTMSYYS
jgi:ABC-type sugar transport system permease subunit